MCNSQGVEIMVGRWRFPIQYLFSLIKIFPKFTKKIGSLRQSIFDKLDRNTKTNFHHAM